MITKEKILVYKKYDGDIDMWARLNRKSERFMSDDDWRLIESFIQDLQLIKNGHASDAYAQQFENRLIEECDGLETISEIKDLISDEKVAGNKVLKKGNFFQRMFGSFIRKG